MWEVYESPRDNLMMILTQQMGEGLVYPYRFDALIHLHDSNTLWTPHAELLIRQRLYLTEEDYRYIIRNTQTGRSWGSQHKSGFLCSSVNNTGLRRD